MKNKRTYYWTDEARRSAIQNIKRLRQIIGKISGEHISYTDARAIGQYLMDYAELIERDLDFKDKE